MRQRFFSFLLLLTLVVPVGAQVLDASRGKLLYSTHCVECHSVQMHWRNQRSAQDWDSLRAQVRRWQGTVNLQWSEQDIDAVTRHLNDTIYGFPQGQLVGRAAAR